MGLDSNEDEKLANVFKYYFNFKIELKFYVRLKLKLKICPQN